ncbi:hypothetical protein [Candidatus Nitrosocosmicus sp. T]
MDNFFMNIKYFLGFTFILITLYSCYFISVNASYGTMMFPDTNSTTSSLENNTNSLNSTTELTDMFVSGQEKSKIENNTDFNNLS